MTHYNKGFTLVELSISMVIIGLIIGGILMGQELIHGAGTRATISQITKYNVAVNTFQMKYDALPGDFKDANTYIPGSYPGNGDGLIGSVAGPSIARYAGGPAIISTTIGNLEYGNFWSHLSASQLIEGSYPTVSDPAVALAKGTNFPTTKISSEAGIFAYGNTGDTTNYYHLGIVGVDSNQAAAGAVNFLSPGDAYAIDAKMDDGIPTSGIIAARGLGLGPEGYASWTGSATLSSSDVSNCVIGIDYLTATAYNTAAPSSAASCQLRIRIN